MKKTGFLALVLCCGMADQAQVKGVKHVILVGMDGLGAYAMEKAGNPVMKQMKDGCWTLKARSVLPSSSAVNWASMIMGAEKNQRSCSYIPISRTARGMVSGTTFPGIMNKCIRTTFY